MQLAIDTSTDYCGLALGREGKTMAEVNWKAGQNHTTQLIPALRSLLQLVRAEPGELTSIAVALGPGSYNGLRAGLSTAKGFAFSLGIPVVGVGTLEVEAYPHRPGGMPVRPVHNAGREEIATALYQRRDDRWQEMEAPHLTTIALLCRRIHEPTVLCGELTADLVSELKSIPGDLAIIHPPTPTPRRAGWLLELAWQRLRMGDADNPTTLQPIYLREPAITIPRPRPTSKGAQRVHQGEPSPREGLQQVLRLRQG